LRRAALGARLESTMDPAIESAGRAPGRGRLEGRRILVVGAGQQDYGIEDPPIGNGRATCLLCAREGAAVAVADVDGDSAAATARMLEKHPARAITIVADAADEAQSERMVGEAAEGLGGLDGLVLNLGIAAVGGMETPVDQWDRAFAVNVRSHFLACRHALPVMADRGAVVLVSSVAARLPLPGMPAYTASKAALSGLLMYLAGAGAERGIRANMVVPGLIDTPLGRLSARVNPERSRVRIPLSGQGEDRQGTAWDVAHAIVYLLSGESAYVTAQEICVDGGLAALRA
jgi:NAD(P)-dependent dehydrogenase (short-subunit alcohol dehydrogenase family)